MAAATGNNEVLGLGQYSGFGFLESASETSHLGGLLHEKVKESFKVFGLSGKHGLVSTSYLHFKRFTFNMYSRT